LELYAAAPRLQRDPATRNYRDIAIVPADAETAQGLELLQEAGTQILPL
jgi:hypothetical protein